jgi:hypothetical protein
MEQRSSLWASGGSPQRNGSHVKQAREGVNDGLDRWIHRCINTNQCAQVLPYLGNHKPPKMGLVKISRRSRKAKFGKEDTDNVGERLHCQAQIALVVHLPTREIWQTSMSPV